MYICITLFVVRVLCILVDVYHTVCCQSVTRLVLRLVLTTHLLLAIRALMDGDLERTINAKVNRSMQKYLCQDNALIFHFLCD